ncbi:uncharacterized protein LOC127263192 [Andrographis paniculata]|uniref:uncharacterized protein LOC127263192 n=1 Tax=Andrographis paniculata TaxID=175694 RepID=UPI0021E954F9|nr:uncharacterized protein LOC127263192 [Andrographis paniculata]
MATDDNVGIDFYAVLGLQKECTATELKHAYKTLALKWHPDRVSASGSSRNVEEAKGKFQAIQQAYSVLSDANKRFLYDVGVYDSNDDDDENGMGEFLNEMVSMMNQTECDEGDSFEELEELFDQMLRGDMEAMFGSSCSAAPPTPSTSMSSCSETYTVTNKRNSSEMSPCNPRDESVQGFCFGAVGTYEKHLNGRKNTRKGRR